MKLIIAAFAVFASMSASAECWVVGDMKGTTYSKVDAYRAEKDGFSGAFHITISGKNADVRYSGMDAGGVDYTPLSENTIIGVTGQGESARAIETWAIMPDGNVTMTKTITGAGQLNGARVFVGKVKGKC